MNTNKLVGLGLFILIVAVAFGWTAGKSNADEGLEQRVSGLEARVTILEQQVNGASRENSVSTPAAVNVNKLVINVSASNNFDAGGFLRDAASYDRATKACSLSGSMAAFHSGATVSAENESGQVIGTGELVTLEGYQPLGTDTPRCKFVVEIELPPFEFVVIKIGNYETDPVSFESLNEQDWEIDFVLDYRP